MYKRQLGDNGQARGFPGFAQQGQPLGPHALKGVGRGAGLERAAPQKACAAGLHVPGHAHDLVGALHAAGAGHHREVPAADLVTGHVHHGVRRVKLAVGLLVGLRNPLYVRCV